MSTILLTLLGALVITPQGESSATEVARRGLVPVPQFEGANSRYLSGDWGGSRSDLAERGFQLDLAFTQTAQGVVDGGKETGWRYGGKLDAHFSFDFDRMGVVPGALVTMRTESRYGESVNGTSGALLPVNDVLYFPLTDEVDKNIPLAITELRYTQFLSKQVGFFLGKFTTLGGDTNEFAGGRGDTQFMSHTFLSASVTALMNPYSTLGGGVLWMPDEQVTVVSNLYSSADSSTTTGFDELDQGWVWSTFVRNQYRLGDLPGGMMVTGQYGFDNDFIDFSGGFVGGDGLQLPRTSDTWCVFWNGWQYLGVEEPVAGLIDVTDGRTDLQGFGLFARAAVADRDTNPIEWILSGGLAGRGVFDGRDHDTFGIGYGFSQVHEKPFVTDRLIDDTGNRFEAYYTVAAAPGAELTLSAQYADTIEASVDPAKILGLRFRLQF